MNPDTTSVQIKRTVHGTRQTLGELTVYLGQQVVYQCKTLELPWLNNAPQKSCIPAATYKVVKRRSPKYGDHFHILEVPNRSYILIHAANYVKQLLGCIAVGKNHVDINGDGLRDVTNSQNTIKMLNSILPDQFELTIS